MPAGDAVDLPGADARGRRPAGWLVDVRYRTVDGALLTIDVAGLDERPEFTEVHHPGAAVPAVSLHAWNGDQHLGEVRWWIRSGLVETVRVEPGSRGRGIGRALVTAAEGLRLVRGWAPLHADGRLTDAAASWLDGAPPWWTPRLAPRTRSLLPEDEAGSPAGVGRLLGDLPTRVI
jgi:GNAT superfamily N-acetyltransferase